MLPYQVALRNIRYCAYFRLRDGLVLASPAIGATSQVSRDTESPISCRRQLQAGLFGLVLCHQLPLAVWENQSAFL